MPVQCRSEIHNTRTGRQVRRGRLHTAGAAAILVVATLGVYLPAFSAGAIWDDALYVLENPNVIRSGEFLQIWRAPTVQQYYPFTETSFWLQYRLWGGDLRCYHGVNIVLHAVVSVLLWVLLQRLSIPGAWLAAMIFAVHPVNVASVAWITELKNVQSMLFYLAAILLYLRFEDCGRWWWYVGAVLAFAAASLSKSAAVVFVPVLLLLAWWRRGKVRAADLVRIVPFLLMAGVMGAVTWWFEVHQSIGDSNPRPEGFASRLAGAGWIICFYVYNGLLPHPLSMIYPRWTIDGRNVLSYLPLAVILGSLAVAWRYRRTWGRALLFGLLYSVISLGPVLGFVSIAFMSYSLVADHWQYLSLPGVIALAVGAASWVVGHVAGKYQHLARTSGTVAACGVVAVLSLLTWRRAEVFKDEETLWTHTISVNDRAWVAYESRGTVYRDRGEYHLALRDYDRAIELRPDDVEVYVNRGVAYDAKGLPQRAILDYDRAIQLSPKNADAYINRGLAYVHLNDYARAIADCTRAITLSPEHVVAYINRGLALDEKGDHTQAIVDYSRAAEVAPDDAGVYEGRAIAYYHIRAYREAWADVARCRRLGGKPSPALLRALHEATGRFE